jgi:hypothetical protein
MTPRIAKVAAAHVGVACYAGIVGGVTMLGIPALGVGIFAVLFVAPAYEAGVAFYEAHTPQEEQDHV